MPDPSPPDLTFAKTADGAQIAWKVIPGRGAGRIALTHSLAMDHRFWNLTAQRLADAGEVLVWDCRGHGRSSKSAGPYTCEQFADDLACVLDAAGWDSCAAAGASMGGSVTLAFAARHPDRLRGLGLVDTTAWYGADAPERWEERAEKARADGLAALVGFQKARWFSPPFHEAHPEIVEACVQSFLANDLDAYVETCRMLGRMDLRAALPGFRTPTRIVVGAEDYATPPSMAEAMHAAIAGSTLRVLPGAAHLTPIEFPDIVADELRQVMTAR